MSQEQSLAAKDIDDRVNEYFGHLKSFVGDTPPTPQAQAQGGKPHFSSLTHAFVQQLEAEGYRVARLSSAEVPPVDKNIVAEETKQGAGDLSSPTDELVAKIYDE